MTEGWHQFVPFDVPSRTCVRGWCQEANVLLITGSSFWYVPVLPGMCRRSAGGADAQQ
jgi:hypothetical protein